MKCQNVFCPDITVMADWALKKQKQLSFSHSFIRSSTTSPTPSLIHSLIHSLLHHSFTHSFIYSFTPLPLIHSHSFTPSPLLHEFVYLFIHSFIPYSLIHSFAPQAQNQRWQDEVDMTIMKRTMEKVDEYLTDNGLDKQLQDTLNDMVRKEMQLVDDEINSIMVDMAERKSLSSSVSSVSSYSSADLEDDEHAQEMLRMYRERGGRPRAVHLGRISQLAGHSARSAKSSAATMAAVPKVMLRGFIRPVRNLMEKIGRVRRRSRFGNNPVLYMKERSEKILGVVCEKTEFFQQMTAKYHEKLDNFITNVDNSIPM